MVKNVGFLMMLTVFQNKIQNKRYKLLTTLKHLEYVHEKPEFEFINHLTPEEVQRPVFIRAVIKNPRLLILDESTNAVGVAMEKKIYEILKSKGIQYISVGHRDLLKQYHDIALTLTGYGDFDLNVINKNLRDKI
uniref:ABC transporter domain-containing protein n=1 Tax=Parastrongyloides trichosuri TaxID=131310 RepID=A0A0N4ZVV1_PARTI